MKLKHQILLQSNTRPNISLTDRSMQSKLRMLRSGFISKHCANGGRFTQCTGQISVLHPPHRQNRDLQHPPMQTGKPICTCSQADPITELHSPPMQTSLL